MASRVPQLLLALALAALGAFSLRADVVELTSGERLEGKIISESESQVSIEVQVSPGIIDRREIPRDEIVKIEKKTQADIEYEALKDVAPPATAFALTTYDQIIARLRKFTQQFPDSPHAQHVKELAAEFEKEKERVAAGEFKYQGEWISQEEVERRRYQISAHLLFETMQEQSRRGDLVGALNAFDRIETEYPGSRVYPPAVELARQLLVALQADVERRLETLKYETAEREKKLELTPEHERAKLIAAAEEEQQRYEAALSSAEKSGAKWKPLNPKSEKSLEAVKNLIPNEGQRLASIPTESMKQSVAFVDQAKKAIEKEDWEAADAALKQAAVIWPQNEAAIRWQKHVAELQAKTAAAASEQPQADEAATPGASQAAPATTPADEPLRTD